MQKMLLKQKGVTVVEVSMFLVVLAIVAVVAIPQFSEAHQEQLTSTQIQSSEKVKSAYAMAIAQKGDFPTLSEVIDYIDADFASENNDLSGIMFRDHGKRLTINTYNDTECSVPTNLSQLGVTDVVRCIRG